MSENLKPVEGKLDTSAKETKLPKESIVKVFLKGIWSNNPGLCQLLGLCPLLAVTTSAASATGLAFATLLVLCVSSFVISLVFLISVAISLAFGSFLINSINSFKVIESISTFPSLIILLLFEIISSVPFSLFSKISFSSLGFKTLVKIFFSTYKIVVMNNLVLHQ